MGTGAMVALSVVQLVAFVGYIGLGGLLMFRAVVTPERGRERPILQIGALGLALMAAAAAARAVILLAGGDGGASTVPVLLVQLGVLVAVACYLPDLFRSALHQWRRATAVAAAILVTFALLLPMITAGGRATFGGLLTAAHVLAVGTWVGGMVVVALLVLPTDASTGLVFTSLQTMLRRTQGKAVALVALLVLSWLIALLLLPGRTSGLSGAFWTVLALKIVLLAALILAAVRVRALIAREVFLNTHVGAAATERLATLRRLVTVEIAIAGAAVAATAVLTVVTPLS